MPGRFRLRIRSRRGDSSFFREIVGVLSTIPQVEEVAANPLTGAVLILHSGASDPITAAAADSGLLAFERGGAGSRSNRGSSLRVPSALDSASTGLGALALLQAARGNITGSATENFWNAYGAKRVLGRADLATGFFVLGLFQLFGGQWLGSASALFFYSLITRQLASPDPGRAPRSE
jgi:hypothetical protein